MSATNESHVIFLDFDGVLSIPWSLPERPYPGLNAWLDKMCEKGFLLCLASFNPRACEVLNNWDVLGKFTAWRAGSNIIWSGDMRMYYNQDIKYQKMSKATQIQDMLNNELANMNVKTCRFFDDLKTNLDQVRYFFDTQISMFQTILVDNRCGVVTQQIVPIEKEMGVCTSVSELLFDPIGDDLVLYTSIDNVLSDI